MVLSTFRTRIVSIGRGYYIVRATDFNQVLRDARLTLTRRAVQYRAEDITGRIEELLKQARDFLKI